MCVFCEIIKGNIPSYTVYEDDIVKCFLDINPDTNGHILIIPKKHTLDIDSIDNDTLLHIFKVSKILKQRLEERLDIDGLTYIQNNGDVQEVKHFHLHLKPYYNNKKELINVEEIYNILKK